MNLFEVSFWRKASRNFFKFLIGFELIAGVGGSIIWWLSQGSNVYAYLSGDERYAFALWNGFVILFSGIFATFLTGFIFGILLDMCYNIADIRNKYINENSTINSVSGTGHSSFVERLNKDNKVSNLGSPWICKECGETNLSNADYCKNCGKYK